MADFEIDAQGAPIAPRIAHETVVHGEKRVDDYHWLRDREDPRLRKYLEAENAFTNKTLERMKEGQKKLFDEILSRIDQADVSFPYADGSYAYYRRDVEGMQYPIYCRKKRDGGDDLCERIADAQEEVVLDRNVLAEGYEYSSIGVLEVSPNERLLAYSHDTEGDEKHDLHIRDIATQKDFENVEIPGTGDTLIWSSDSKIVYYTTLDDTNRSYRIWSCEIETGKTALVYEEKDEKFNVNLTTTADKKYLMIEVSSVVTSEYLVKKNDGSNSPFKILWPRVHDVDYWVDHQEDHWIMGINDTGRNFRLCKIPDSHAFETTKANWIELLPHDTSAFLSGVTCFKNFLVLWQRREGVKTVRIYSSATGQWASLTFPESVFTVSAEKNEVYDTNFVRFEYESMITPETVMAVDMRTNEIKVLKRKPVLGGYDSSNYTTLRLWAPSHDGVLVPITLFHKKDFKRYNGAPAFVYGYGAYGVSTDADFNAKRLCLIDRGFVYAKLHVRGGSDLGRDWYENGKLFKKMNTFLDFIWATKFLIKEGYATQGRIGAYGASAGGLLMGAITAMAPELYKAIIADVPFLDAVNTQLDVTLPLVFAEYDEWGNPAIKEYYDYMMKYSPYDIITEQEYPHVVAICGFNDPRVMYWEPVKWIAKLRRHNKGTNSILLKTYLDEGHGGASGRYDLYMEDAFIYGFMCDKLGVPM